MIRLVLILLLVFSSAITYSQDTILSKGRILKTWVYLDNHRFYKGALYEVKDSSILLSDALSSQNYLSGNFNLTQIDPRNIEHIAVRGKNNVTLGAVLGALAGFAAANGIVNSIARKDEQLGALIFIGLPITTIGAGLGGIIGTIRIGIPVNRSLNDFNFNRSRLEKYSYIKEKTRPGITGEGNNNSGASGETMNKNGRNQPASSKFGNTATETNCLIGFFSGPSVPTGTTGMQLIEDVNEELAKIGGGAGFRLWGIIKGDYGLSTTFFNYTYNLNEGESSEKFWVFSGVLTGPTYSVKLSERSFFMLKPMAGYNFLSLNGADVSAGSFRGFGVYPSALYRFDFSPRWCGMAEAGYFYSRLESQTTTRTIQTVNMNIGVAYKFNLFAPARISHQGAPGTKLQP